MTYLDEGDSIDFGSTVGWLVKEGRGKGEGAGMDGVYRLV